MSMAVSSNASASSSFRVRASIRTYIRQRGRNDSRGSSRGVCSHFSLLYSKIGGASPDFFGVHLKIRGKSALSCKVYILHFKHRRAPLPAPEHRLERIGRLEPTLPQHPLGCTPRDRARDF